MIRIRAKDICQRRAAGMAAATFGRKTREDSRPRSQMRAEADERIAEGLDEWERRR